MRRIAVLIPTLLICLIAGSVAGPLAAAQDGGPADGSRYDEVELQPQPGSYLSWNGTRYSGTFRIRSVDGGLVLVEILGVDDYLLGIQEVPFSWEEDALKAQAVAARTYLAWTLSLGRSGAAATYGFDICATDQCQVYGGVDQVAGPAGERWQEAVRETADEVLLYNGRPAQALYSSTSGGRTRDVRDVFGSREVPYLQAVDSPGEDSPFVEWTVALTGPRLERVLHDAELIHGRLRDIRVSQTEDGTGPWMVEIRATDGGTALSTWQFRREMNRSGNRVLPDELPAPRPDGGRYPQAIMSPTYDIDRSWDVGRDFTTGYVPAVPVYRINGKGWGHLVGMSQFGAQAMAAGGASYDRILAHYYGGLEPDAAPEVLPDIVEVGLEWGEPVIKVGADGPFDVIADGQVIAEATRGTWEFRADAGNVAVLAPAGRGLPPIIRDLPPRSVHPAGVVVRLQAELSAAAETRITVFRGPEVVGRTEWDQREAGPVSFVWDATVAGAAAPPGPYRVVVSVRSADGVGAAITTVVIVP